MRVRVRVRVREGEICISRFTMRCARHEICTSRFTKRSTKTAFRSKTAPIPCTCHEKSTLDHQNTRFPLRLPQKVITMCENAHGTTTGAQSLEAPATDTQILGACAVEMHLEDVEK